MAVEAETANRSPNDESFLYTDLRACRAAGEETAPGVMLTDEDLESPSKKRKVGCKHVCTLMCMILQRTNALSAGVL